MAEFKKLNRRKAEIFLTRKFKKLNIQPTGRKEIEMKVRQFLNKLLYASSSIHRIFVVRGVEEKTQLIGIAVNPMATDTPYEKQLNATLVSFRITGEDLTIYVK